MKKINMALIISVAFTFYFVGVAASDVGEVMPANTVGLKLPFLILGLFGLLFIGGYLTRKFEDENK